MFTTYHNVLNRHEGTRRERWLVNMSQKLMLVQNILAARCVASQCVEVAWGHTPRKMAGEHISEADGVSQCVGGSDKRRTLLIPSLSPAAMVVLVLVQADLWADWSVMTTPPLWFQRLPCTVSFSSPWSPSSASSKFNVWAWRCFLNVPVLYNKETNMMMTVMTLLTWLNIPSKQNMTMIALFVCVNHFPWLMLTCQPW